MRKKKIKLYHQIWHTLLISILGLSLVMIIANATVISGVKDAIIYEQLEDAATYKLGPRESRNEYKKESNEADLNIAHFTIDLSDTTPQITADSFTKSVYMNSDMIKEFDTMTADVIDHIQDVYDQKVKINKQTYYYIIEPLNDSDHYMIFFTSITRRNSEMFLLIGVISLFIVISFMTSKYVAAKIAEPIRVIDEFSKKIAKRQWSALAPLSDIEEIDDLTKSLEYMKMSLQKAEERDRQFLQSTSHDLKTPVMIIKGYAQALKDGVSIDGEQSAAQVILTESERLERRILQLLRLNTLGHSLELHQNHDYIRVDRLLQSLVNKFSVVAPHIEWDLSLSEYELLGDGESLHIAFENIFENQIRYAKDKIYITMSLDQALSISIANNGDPFNVEDPNILFDSYKKDAEGKFGLGLAIVKQVITAHNGSITAKNHDNGVCFEIRINSDNTVKKESI